ncbi:MAG: ATP-dependent nuclease [bacterium]
MQLIKSITIRYLRSIHRLPLKKIGDLTVFSGANDVGKSNILKTLNLFFNNEVDWLDPIDFYRDFSLRRLDEVRRESIKGKQFIRIDVEFRRPSSYSGSLPPTFTVTKWWFRDSRVPQEDSSLEKQIDELPSTLETARRMLSRFLNRVHFEYVPAIRDREYYEYVLENLQETLITTQMKSDDPILNAVRELNANIEERARSLQEEFGRATAIEASVSLPTDPKSLFRAFTVNTKWQNEAMKAAGEEQEVLLALRGDGIQACYVPALLNYIAENSFEFYLWGFEEPENSIEYNLAIDLADRFRKIYSEQAQIFVTSHSPAFVSLEGPEVVSYRVHKEGDTTQATELYPSEDKDCLHQLSEDIGLLNVQKEVYEQYLETRENWLEAQREADQLRSELADSSKPVVYVEGKHDATLLNTAWEKLCMGETMPFTVKHCDPLPEGEGGGAGGAGTLTRLLSTMPSDSPHLAIGIFDRDKEGIDAYSGLPNYFEEIADLDARVSRSLTAVAFLLPVPPGRERYADLLNFDIEFYFSEDALTQTTPEGYGLVFEQPEIEVRLRRQGHPLLETRESDLAEARQIVSGKGAFAESIVPELDPQEFEHFGLIFDRVEEVLDYITQRG